MDPAARTKLSKDLMIQKAESEKVISHLGWRSYKAQRAFSDSTMNRFVSPPRSRHLTQEALWSDSLTSTPHPFSGLRQRAKEGSPDAGQPQPGSDSEPHVCPRCLSGPAASPEASEWTQKPMQWRAEHQPCTDSTKTPPTASSESAPTHSHHRTQAGQDQPWAL